MLKTAVPTIFSFPDLQCQKDGISETPVRTVACQTDHSYCKVCEERVGCDAVSMELDIPLTLIIKAQEEVGMDLVELGSDEGESLDEEEVGRLWIWLS